MNKTLVLCLSVLVSACGTGKVSYQQQAEAHRQQQIAVQTQTVNSAPDWFQRPPTTPGVLYATGTFASRNWDLANRTAVDLALGKICVKMGGEVKQQSRVFQREVNGTTQEFSETAIKSLCPNINVAGFELASRETITDINGRIRVYVLIAMSANGAPLNESVLDTVNQAFDALDTAVSASNQTANLTGTVKLLDVDNAEYKQRRDSCLQRPDCVIGHVTVR